MEEIGIGKLAEALAKAQGQMKHAAKDSANPFFKSKYADLASIVDACRKALAENGLAVIQTTAIREYGLVLVTTLAHTSGESIFGELPIRPVKDDPQGMGSAMTYARRYALAAIVGVATEDDDGNSASRPAGDETPRPEPRARPAAAGPRPAPAAAPKPSPAASPKPEGQKCPACGGAGCQPITKYPITNDITHYCELCGVQSNPVTGAQRS